MADGLIGTKIAVIGGCGHVGLPLGVKFCLAGAQTVLIDINETAVKTVSSGRFPFIEANGDQELGEALERGLQVTTDPAACKGSDVVVFVTGTPVDEHLNPKVSEVVTAFEAYESYLSPGTLIIMRSTLFPGTMEFLWQRLGGEQSAFRLAFCPERVSQGFGLAEIDSLPQIVSAFDKDSEEAACQVFGALAPELLLLTPLEAEIAKLMSNSWRYLEFAIANQFYMIAESRGVDFSRVYQAIRYKYPRAAGYKSPGFAAGPCLFKDTMQLASFFDNNFSLGHAAMLVNEGLANFVVDKMVDQLSGDLWGKTVGLLGMTFKADSDDIRESLSFKVRKGLEFRGARVVFHDPFLAESSSLDEVIETADGLILCTPHSDYRQLQIEKPLVDVWGMFYKTDLQILPGTS